MGTFAHLCANILNLLAHPTGFEPVTSAFGGQAPQGLSFTYVSLLYPYQCLEFITRIGLLCCQLSFPFHTVNYRFLLTWC